MKTLPAHGRIECNRCFKACGDRIEFDTTQRADGNWRITANPLAWGNKDPEILVLGFSKGPTQAGALASAAHNDIAYKGSRGKMAKILEFIGLMTDSPSAVSDAIAQTSGRFHFGSLIRCTVESYDESKGAWLGSGGGMLDKFIQTPFGQEIATNCTHQYLSDLPSRTKLVVMFGLGSKLNYVKESFKLYEKARSTKFTWLNEISYTDGKITVVHVEHFASQGHLIDDWLGNTGRDRKIYGHMALDAVKQSGIKLSEKSPITVISVPVKLADKQPDQVLLPVVTKKMRAMLGSNDASKLDISNITTVFESAGYKEESNTKKVISFKSRSGQILYVLKGSTHLNKIDLVAHPVIQFEVLQRLVGVDTVGEGYYHNANMNRFPKRKHKGKTEIHYGRKINLSTFSDLPKFLAAFQTVGL